jgi:aminoglycoside 6'-N-acetyltransferase
MARAHPVYPVQPVLGGRRVRIRPGRPGDAERLRAILAEPSVSRWWGAPDPLSVIEDGLRGDDEGLLLVVEADGEVAGGIQYSEEDDPMYRHAGIDIYLGTRFQGRGAGTEAVALLARFLFEEHGHHRITIDPAAHNERAIRSYAKVGFRPVGVMRQYERGPDGQFHDGLLMDLLRDELTAELRFGSGDRRALVEVDAPAVGGPEPDGAAQGAAAGALAEVGQVDDVVRQPGAGHLGGSDDWLVAGRLFGGQGGDHLGSPPAAAGGAELGEIRVQESFHLSGVGPDLGLEQPQFQPDHGLHVLVSRG